MLINPARTVCRPCSNIVPKLYFCQSDSKTGLEGLMFEVWRLMFDVKELQILNLIPPCGTKLKQ
jgi:hypothetical protein